MKIDALSKWRENAMINVSIQQNRNNAKLYTKALFPLSMAKADADLLFFYISRIKESRNFTTWRINNLFLNWRAQHLFTKSNMAFENKLLPTSEGTLHFYFCINPLARSEYFLICHTICRYKYEAKKLVYQFVTRQIPDGLTNHAKNYTYSSETCSKTKQTQEYTNK